MNIKKNVELYISLVVILVGIALIVCFAFSKNYLDLVYGILLIFYSSRLYYLVYRKRKGFVRR